MLRKELIPGIQVGDDPEKVLSWTTVGYDYVAKEYPKQHLFEECISAATRIKAQKARVCMQFCIKLVGSASLVVAVLASALRARPCQTVV